ncbi:MAG: indolepyruvate ferredoxin oxidoreductase [Bacteroidales bacterium]|nr:indolepyruvate ferredoxin oxidoreductase [Candidatus Cacconaster merdequi]
MENKRLLLGDEAIALGAIHAGLSGVYAYPGTPSTEITEFIQEDGSAKGLNIRSRWCTNEKTAMEAALGMSFAGKRALVCMKHVGMNVCADAFVNSAITGVNGGLVVIAADDPSMHSSQNEQDSRHYGKFAMIPVFEPSNQQECYEMMKEAFSLSEELKLPVMMRVVTRLAHSRSVVVTGESLPQNPLNAEHNPQHWVLLPGIARRQYSSLIEKQGRIAAFSDSSRFNSLKQGRGEGIIACGIGYNYVMEALSHSGKDVSLLKVSQYPVPAEKVKEMAACCSSILVVEDGQPVVEQDVKGIVGGNFKVEGRLTGRLPRTGELTPDSVAAALGINGEITYSKAENVAARPPQLCNGCGHRDVYTALGKILSEYKDARVFGDIGCYTLGALPPFKALDSCVDMGASITMAKGAADAGVFPSVAIIGDSTFTHSGMTGLLDAVNDNANITIVISDNLTTGMTGGQDSAGTNKFEAICLGLGVDPAHVRVVVPTPANMEGIVATIREEIEYKGVSVIIPRRECMKTLNRRLRKARAEKRS